MKCRSQFPALAVLLLLASGGACDAAAGTKARDEWIKMKMDTRQYKSSALYGTPRDPALRKEMDDYIKAHQPPKQN